MFGAALFDDEDKRCVTFDTDRERFVKNAARYVCELFRSDFPEDNDVTCTDCFLPDFADKVETILRSAVPEAEEDRRVLGTARAMVEILTVVMPYYHGPEKVWLAFINKPPAVPAAVLPFRPRWAPARRALTVDEVNRSRGYAPDEEERFALLGAATRDWTLIYEERPNSKIIENPRAATSEAEVRRIVASIQANGRCALVLPPGQWM